MSNTLNRSIQIFKKLAIFNGSVLLSMSLQRLVLFLVVVRHWVFNADGFSVGMSFLNGARFDLCVLGFMNIPVVFIVWWLCSDAMAMAQNHWLQRIRRWILWVYLGVTTLIIHALGLLDMMFFALNNQRWTYYAWQESGFSFFNRVASAWGGVFTFGVIALFLMLWIFRCLFVLYKVQLQILPEVGLKFGKSKGILVLLGIVLPFVVTALAARGTWTAHHINMEHAREVSENPSLIQMTLSPVWAFDKKF